MMAHPTRRRTHPRGPHAGPWLLEEDGIVDPVAVDIAAAGTRPVRLTATERELAAARILAAGGTAHHVAARLHMSHDTARRVCADLTGTRGEEAA